MAVFNFRTYTQSVGPETFESGEIALDVIQIPIVELLATFSALANGDDVYIRQHSGLRQYVPELCGIWGPATITAGQFNLFVDGVNTNILLTQSAAFSSAAAHFTADTPGAWTYALTHTTPDGGSGIGLHMVGVPTGTGTLYVQVATRAAQS